MTTNCIGLQQDWKGTNTKDKWTDRSFRKI